MADAHFPASLPTQFLARLSELVPPLRLQGVLEGFAGRRETCFRINGLHANPTKVLDSLEAQGLRLAEFEPIPAVYCVPFEQRRILTETDEFVRGEIYVQNPASMLPPLVLCPNEQEWVLDLAAAPGSKTLQLAEMMGNRGRISAVESVRARFFRLRANLRKHGARNVRTYLKDGARVWRQVAERFDKVLLDAPCSSEGQFRTDDPASFRFWSERKIAEMSRKQKRLLFSAIQCARTGGEIVYSTCTLAPEENEAVVDAMLRRFPEALSLEPVRLPVPGLEPGRTRWRGKHYHEGLVQAVRLLPDARMEGFFICRLRKHGSTLTDRPRAERGPAERGGVD